MSDVQLGKLALRHHGRDAIHLAVIQVQANETLKPGEHVGLVNGKAQKTNKNIGIVDPFIEYYVSEGQRFWLCLYPNTTTGMSHHWTHPSFDSPPVKPTKEESKEWIMDFIKKGEAPNCFDTLIAAATGGEVKRKKDYDLYYSCAYGIDEEYLHFYGTDASGDIPTEFWEHVENYTGLPCPLKPKFFSCSC